LIIQSCQNDGFDQVTYGAGVLPERTVLLLDLDNVIEIKYTEKRVYLCRASGTRADIGEDEVLAGYFSLLWESEEGYREWCRSLRVRETGYIEDLHLKLVYEEIYRAGRFWEPYGFEEVFLYPCARRATVIMRQKIMRQFYEDSILYEAALAFVSCVVTLQKRLEGLSEENGPSKDERKKMISALQIRYDFLVSLEIIHEKVSGHIQKGMPLAECAEKLAGFISDDKVVSEKGQLSEFLSALDRNMPHSIILNKEREQTCRSVVIDPEGTQECGYTERLALSAEPFLGKYDFKVGVYQNTDISHLDKRIQEHVCQHMPGLVRELEGLYEKYGQYDISRFVRAAKELVFYLSCIRFVREYEKAGFFFSMPDCTSPEGSDVRGAYDMTLGINQYRKDKSCGVVPNDYRFGEKRRVFILTGANQGGKTTFIRSIGLIQCMAQVGMFVPCRKASLRMVGRIHTQFSREDERGAVVGRFEQELQGIQEILKNLRDGDMVLLNETFTSTQRSVAVVLLKRLLEEMAHRHCCGGLVTHFYEVGDGLKGEGFYSLVTEVAGDGEGKERTYRIREGASARYSFARDIAVKCGVTYEKLMEERVKNYCLLHEQ